MKKSLLTLFAVAVALVIGLTSCGSKDYKDMTNAEILDEYAKMQVEVVNQIQALDLPAEAPKAIQIMEEAEKKFMPLTDELNRRGSSFTPEETATFLQITENLAKGCAEAVYSNQ